MVMRARWGHMKNTERWTGSITRSNSKLVIVHSATKYRDDSWSWSKMRSCVKIQRDDSWSCEQHEVMCVCCLDLCIVRLEIEGGSLGLPVRVPGICISPSVETRFLRGYRSLVWILNSNTNFRSLSNRSWGFWDGKLPYNSTPAVGTPWHPW